MAKNVSLKKNFVMNAILAMSSFIFPLITFPYVSRILGPTGTGSVSFAASLISYFNMFAQLGIPTYGIRICASVRDDKEKLSRIVHELLFINLVTSIISYIALAIALIFVPRLQYDRTLYIITSFTIILSTMGMEWLYKAMEQYSYITIRSVFFKFIAMIGMFVLIHEPEDYVVYGAITIFASSASYILNMLNARKFIYLHPVGGYDFKRHLKPVAVFFAMACATTVYTHLDTVMLGFMTTEADVGFYNAAVKIKTILVSVVTSLGTVVLPRASYYIKNNQMEQFRRITEKALNFVCLVSLPMTVYFILFAKEGILFLSGDQYTAAIVPMQIIMPTLFLIGLSNIMGIQILVPLGREKVVLHSEIAGAVVDLIINALLIPSMASSGAALGTLVAELVVTLYQYIALKDEITEAYKKIRIGSILIAIVLGTAVSVAAKFLGTGYFVTLVISAVLFFGVYAGYLTLRKEPLVCEIEGQIFGKIKSRFC